jgi:hypothetical protein
MDTASNTTERRTEPYTFEELYDLYYFAPCDGFNGRVLVADLIDRLLDFPMDAEYLFSMQEGKGHPMMIEGYQELFIYGSGERIMRSSSTSRKASPALTSDQEYGARQVTGITDRGTIRSLIHALVGLDPKGTLDIKGHFYSGFSFKFYPAPVPRQIARSVPFAVEEKPVARIVEPEPKGLFAQLLAFTHLISGR